MTRHRGIIPWARLCFAVDLCSSAAPVVVRAERSGGVRVRSSSIEEAAAAASRGVPVVGVVGVREGFARWLAAPYPNLAKARRVLPTLLDVDLPFPLEDCLYSFVGQRLAGDGSVALAVGARRVDIERRLDAYTEHGVDPAAAFHQGVALWSQASREVAREPGTAGQRPRAVVYLSSSAPALVVGESEDPAGLHGLRPDDVVGHVRQLMRARFSLGTAVEWIFAGPGVDDVDGLDRIRTEVTTDWPGPASVARDPGEFLARALAWEALAGSALGCNLRSGALVHPVIGQRSRTRNTRAAVAALLAGLALCGVNLGWRMAVEGRDDTLDDGFRSRASELAGFPVVAKGRDAVEQVRTAVESAKAQWEPFVAACHPQLSATVAEVAARSAEANIELRLLTGTDSEFRLAGDGPTWEAPESLVPLLSSRGYAVSLDRRDARDDGRVPFTLDPGGRP